MSHRHFLNCMSFLPGGEWRIKYTRAIREMDFAKKKLQQEFDDKLETEQQSKRQLERKARKKIWEFSPENFSNSNVWLAAHLKPLKHINFTVMICIELSEWNNKDLSVWVCVFVCVYARCSWLICRQIMKICSTPCSS